MTVERNLIMAAAGNVTRNALSGSLISSNGNGTVSRITPAAVVTQNYGAWAFGGTFWAAATDYLGNVYATDTANDALLKITNATTSSIINTWGAGYAPRSIVVDTSNNVYVAGYNGGIGSAVAKITSAGVVTTSWASIIGGSAGITSMVIDSSNNIYTANSNLGKISKITSAGGAVANNWATLSASSVGLLAIDGSNNIYCIGPTNVVSKITPAGVVTSNYATLSADTYYGITADLSGNVYIARRTGGGTGYISKISSSGVLTETWVTLTGFGVIRGITTDALGNVYAADQSNTSAVAKITPAGAITNPWASLNASAVPYWLTFGK